MTTRTPFRLKIIVGLSALALAAAGSFGIVKAQAQTAALQFSPDHYLGYRISVNSPRPWTPVTVGLADQFTINFKAFTLTKPERLYNPAVKIISPVHSSGVYDFDAHLIGYTIEGHVDQPVDPPVKELLVSDQFGHYVVDTLRPVMVLVPTAKDIGVDPMKYDPAVHQLDHFKCYTVKVTGSYNANGIFGASVFLRDQFRQARMFKVGPPSLLCTPARKSHGLIQVAIQNPDAQLLCHKVKPITPLQTVRNIRTKNQFGYERLTATGEVDLCAPARKLHDAPMPEPVFEPTATPTQLPATATTVPAATATPVPTGTATPTQVPAATATPVPTGTATPTQVPAATATPVPTATATPTFTPTATPGPQTHTGTIVNFVLPSISIRIGDTVLWVNQDGAPHTASAGTPGNIGPEFRSPILSNVQTYAHTFSTAGTFPYFCEVHNSMTASVTVSP